MKTDQADTLRIVPRRGGAHWQVMDGDKSASIVYDRLESAMARLERLQRKARIRIIPCLRCRARFPSEGAHNRMCAACRNYAASVNGAMA